MTYDIIPWLLCGSTKTLCHILVSLDATVPLAHTKGPFPPLSKGVNRMAQEVSYQPFQFKTVVGIISTENLSRCDKPLTAGDNCFATEQSPLLPFFPNRPLKQ